LGILVAAGMINYIDFALGGNLEMGKSEEDIMAKVNFEIDQIKLKYHSLHEADLNSETFDLEVIDESIGSDSDGFWRVQTLQRGSSRNPKDVA
jgi:hypothetical protein